MVQGKSLESVCLGWSLLLTHCVTFSTLFDLWEAHFLIPKWVRPVCLLRVAVMTLWTGSQALCAELGLTALCSGQSPMWMLVIEDSVLSVLSPLTL